MTVQAPERGTSSPGRRAAAENGLETRETGVDETGHTPDDRDRDLRFSAAAFVGALLPRLYVALAWAREPVWDGHYYDAGARRIAAGLGYSADAMTSQGPVWQPWCHYPVGYSGFLALFYRIFGSGTHTGTVVNAIVGALLVVIVHRVSRRALSPRRARIAAVLVAASPGLIVYSAVLMTEPLAATGTLAAVWLMARDRATRPLRGALLAGIALGLTTLVRPQTLVCAPALALLAWHGPSLRARLGQSARVAAIATATSLAVVAPWTLRNCRVMDGCALVSTNAGWNLAIGSFPRATGRFETLRGTDGCPVVTGQVQQDRCWMTEGRRWIAEDPQRWLALVPRKLSFTFDHESFPIGYLGEADPSRWPEDRRANARAVLTTSHRALLTAAAFALIAWPARLVASGRHGAAAWQLGVATLLLVTAWLGFSQEPHVFWPIAVAIPVLALLRSPGAPRQEGVIDVLAFLIASVCVTHAVFFGEDRYHMIVTPALCVLAAAALRDPRVPPAERPG